MAWPQILALAFGAVYLLIGIIGAVGLALSRTPAGARTYGWLL
jgi:hypothetical protein